SQVCAIAIERELDQLEARPPVADPAIQEVIRRFQSNTDKWRQRGYEAGRGWAIKRSTRQELEYAARAAPSEGMINLLRYEIFQWPASFDAEQTIKTAVSNDLNEASFFFADDAQPATDETTTDGEEEKRARAEVEDDAFLDGWLRTATAVWEAVAPALR
ncbi:MAG: hypothetical protein JOZ65_33040, partial [Chloroflexi bacterium]|nr:hypothetical protein [Chloroflexota bacterium]